MKKQPAYLKVYYELKKEILNKKYEKENFLPPEPKLGELFGVSRTTVRKAVEMLAADGYVRVQQGRGTEVIRETDRQGLSIATSITETLEKNGYTVRLKEAFIDEIPADESLARELQIKEKEPVVRLRRIQLADEEPIAILKNYIPKEKVPDFARKMGEGSSVYSFLEQEYGYIIDSAKDVISARPAEFVDAEILRVDIGTPLLCIRRITFFNGKPVTSDRIHVRYDKYELQVNMQNRQTFLDYK